MADRASLRLGAEVYFPFSETGENHTVVRDVRSMTIVTTSPKRCENASHATRTTPIVVNEIGFITFDDEGRAGIFMIFSMISYHAICEKR